MYTTRFCPFCVRARQLLQGKGVDFEEIAVDGNPQRRAEMRTRSGRHTVPQIWVGERHVGGFDDLWMLEQQGQLDRLLADI
jgi:glutaredoxin 3